MPRALDILILLTYVMVAVVAAIGFDYLGLMNIGLQAWMMGAIVFIVAGMAHSAAVHGLQERKRPWKMKSMNLKAANLALVGGISGRPVSASTRSPTSCAPNRLSATTPSFTRCKVLEDLVRRVSEEVPEDVPDVAIPVRRVPLLISRRCGMRWKTIVLIFICSRLSPCHSAALPSMRALRACATRRGSFADHPGHVSSSRGRASRSDD